MKSKPIAHAIKKCRACANGRLTTLLILGNQGLSDFTISKNKPLRYPLTLVICEACRLVQLKHTVAQSQLYTERYGYKSGINNTMQQELRKIVVRAKERIGCSHEGYVAVDIGANDGTLLRNYEKSVFTIGIEPIKKFAQECQKYANIVVNDFFSYQSYVQNAGNKKAHIMTAISCFYDMENPNAFIGDAKKILHAHGILIIQQNYLPAMLRYGAFDNIVHEHLEYYSLLSLENLLRRHQLEVFDVELSYVNGGSFRTYIAHESTREISKNVLRLRGEEKKLKLDKRDIYLRFANRVKKNKEKINRLVKKLIRNNKKIYLYGASTRGNTLLQYFGLDHRVISAAVERNPEKWGKYISSVGIPIISEEQARKDKPDYMLILPWFFKEEFLDREKEYLASGGHFIFPLPKVEIF